MEITVEKNFMIVRKANPEESGAIARLIFLAMKDIIYQFIGEDSTEKAIDFLDSLVKEKKNQYSYQNCWVVDSDHTIVAAAIVYDGGDLAALREPVANKIKVLFDRPFQPEDETQAGEFYIDCIGVDPSQQGKGIGSIVLHHLIEEYVIGHKQKLGLLVDKDNPNAKKLYLKLGFEVIGEKTLANKLLEHLQFGNKTNQ